MTWLAIKTWLSKAWVWCKAHWELLLGIGLGLAAMIIFRKGVPDFTSLYRQITERQKEEMDVIEAAHQKELLLREEAEQRAADAMKQVEEEYQRRSEDLDAKKRREVKKTIAAAKNDPEEMSRKLAELTGATFVPRSE